MTNSDIISLISLCIAGLTLFYAIFVDIKNRRITKNQDALNIKLLSKELKEDEDKQRAEINATLYKNINKNWTLKIFNKGSAKAKNVNWKIIGEDPGWFFHSNAFPLEFLNPSQSVDIQVIVMTSNKNKAKIKIMWEDDKLKNNEWETILVL